MSITSVSGLKRAARRAFRLLYTAPASRMPGSMPGSSLECRKSCGRFMHLLNEGSTALVDANRLPDDGQRGEPTTG